MSSQLYFVFKLFKEIIKDTANKPHTKIKIDKSFDALVTFKTINFLQYCSQFVCRNVDQLYKIK